MLFKFLSNVSGFRRYKSPEISMKVRSCPKRADFLLHAYSTPNDLRATLSSRKKPTMDDIPIYFRNRSKAGAVTNVESKRSTANMIDNSPRIILVSSDFIVSSLRRLPI
jgi:hypothetical protein